MTETITIEYVPTSPFSTGRKTITGELIEKTGSLVYMSTSLDDVTLILDGDGDLWARDANGDGLFGTIACIVE